MLLAPCSLLLARNILARKSSRQGPLAGAGRGKVGALNRGKGRVWGRGRGTLRTGA